MSRINLWKTAVVAGSTLSIIALLYRVTAGLSAYGAIDSYLAAMNAGDYSLSENLAGTMGSSLDALDKTGIVLLAALVLQIVSLIGWTHANAKLAHEVNPGALTHSSGWAIGSWFVPFLNFVRPRRILSESLRIITSKPLEGLLTIWWVLFIIDALAGRASDAAFNKAVSSLESTGNSGSLPEILGAFDSLLGATAGDIASSTFSIVPLLLSIILVIRAYPAGDPLIVSHTHGGIGAPLNQEVGQPEITNYATPTALLEPEFKLCSFCAEEIRFNAIKCKHCGSTIS